LERGQEGDPGINERARRGAINSTTATTVGDQTTAALRARPDITVVFAPHDEFARGVKLGAEEAGLASKIKVYSPDISTSDIQEIREERSPWVATAATNPTVAGEVSLRALALLVAEQDPGHVVELKPTLITRDDLVKNDIKTIVDLAAKFPAFGHSDVATAPGLYREP
jgi:simple sugar transport system substrate-binding protein